MSEFKLGFGKALVEQDLGVTASCVTDDCFKYGIVNGCDSGCPQLIRGECERQDDECKDLYQEAIGAPNE